MAQAVLWLLLGAYHLLFSLPSWSSRLRLLWREVLPIALLTLTASVAADAIFYNRHLTWSELLLRVQTNPRSLPIVSLNFLRLNSGSDLAALYGTHPWHWYFSEGLPTNLGPMTPFFLWALVRFLREAIAPAGPAGVPSRAEDAKEAAEAEEGVAPARQSRRSLLLLLATLAWSMATFSCNAHKEFRFILPVTPVAFLLVGRWMAGLERGTTDASLPPSPTGASAIQSEQGAEPESETTPAADGMRLRRKGADRSLPPTAAAAAALAAASSQSSRRPLRLVVAFLLVTNVLMGGYLTFVHQSGPARVFALLREVHAKWVDQRPCAHPDFASCSQSQPLQALRVHFLLNCHSMPFYSHMHVPQDEGFPRTIDLHFLDCSPLSVGICAPTHACTHARTHAFCSLHCLFSSFFFFSCYFLLCLHVLMRQIHQRLVARQRFESVQRVCSIRARSGALHRRVLRRRRGRDRDGA